MIIAVDVDEVCAELMNVWLSKYNKDYNDNLNKSIIKEWGINEYVKPECGDKIFDYIEDGSIYDSVEPVYNSLWGVNELKNMGFRVIYATMCPLLSSGIKFNWLKNHKFIDKEDDYIEARDKSLIYSDFLIDDNIKNISSFRNKGYIYTQPWNKNYNTIYRMNNWIEIIYIFNIIRKTETNL